MLESQILTLRRKLREGPTLQEGDVLAEQYRLVRRVGKGGFATVWEAYDRKRRRARVAIKVLHGQFARDASRVERFLRGARIMDELNHPNIVRVLDPDLEDGGHRFFVMEHVPGGDLAAKIAERSFTPETVLDLMEVVGTAMAACHRRGIIHRDLKPANILLALDGSPKVTDFDLVRAADTTGGTRTGALGTIIYAAPECMEHAQEADARADVYGLSMTTLVGVLGQRPSWREVTRPTKLVHRLPVSAALQAFLARGIAELPDDRPADAGAWLAELREARAQGGAAPAVVADEPATPVPTEDETPTDDLTPAFPPHLDVSWADDAGRDDFGIWAEVRVEDVAFRMRWIEPGTFLMGSPEDEEERWDREGPRHEVTLSEGYWMAETPCTQALWLVVMGENPSGFEGPERPVETVNWEDTQAFFQRLEARHSGLEPRLPTEAQWEYACRAGSDEARYGPLDAVAWYEGNSGAESHPVRAKAPNAWGLYDTLGNVDEWCRDGATGSGSHGRPYGPAAVFDPFLSPAELPKRVVRGGSWRNSSRNVRAACRFSLPRENRNVLLGFRVSREAHTGDGRRPSGAVPPARGARSASTQRVAPDSPEPPSEELAWTAHSGRDAFGIWGSTDVKGVELKMRWIPPGTFMMGSPDEEEDRLGNEGPRREVTLTRGFWMGETPCTQDLWAVVMGSSPSQFKGERRPVETVSWEDARVFFQKLAKLKPSLVLALPTEAEWEYACRAGDERARYGRLDDVAWYDTNSGRETHPVGAKASNAWGLYDTLGNVWEWCHDFYRDYTEGTVVDPTGPRRGDERVLRGGSWDGSARHVRAASRFANDPSYRGSFIGFRLSRGQAARSPPPGRRP